MKTYDELTSTLSPRTAQAFFLCPMFIGADSIDIETYVVESQTTVTEQNHRSVAQAFRLWYKNQSPDEYHDPANNFGWR